MSFDAGGPGLEVQGHGVLQHDLGACLVDISA
jgi:hypothetical protein